ncbi:FtsH protease activity modulator HflK [Guptibacillus algicola]|uniref:FtsH protease activity modulator HflK n=1 Tax=Guptibacillus algicola TaxID=225844 RepID=UPI001CD68B19|nr:FtsH protease activity modulator HflK [Alkalihalobacillus algicola]MCA0988988.1 FtsH protease activity modulator HflK [Alkalihalobacillus algicola]
MSQRRIAVIAGSIVLFLLLGVVLVTSWYTVDESEQAVIMTFGKVDEEISDAGLHFKLPWPIQQVDILPRETFSLTFGYDEKDGEIVDYPKETKMVTGDENIVLADLVVQWRITNPKKYLYYSDQPKEILYAATSASLRGVIGSSEIDEALTSGKAEIEGSVREILTKLIDEYEIGISILDVKLQDVELPNDEVRKAFTNVVDAREQKETTIYGARKYKNQELSVVEGQKDARISKAQGKKAQRIEQARGDVATFNALYNEYKNSPEVTKKRLILETLEEVLPDTKIYITDEGGDTVKYLPIQPGKTEKPKGSESNE